LHEAAKDRFAKTAALRVTVEQIGLIQKLGLLGHKRLNTKENRLHLMSKKDSDGREEFYPTWS
jgi:hypothetical protein